MKVNYSDRDIIEIIESGDKDSTDRALRYLYKTCHPLVLNMITKNKGNREDAADIFQESVIVLYEQIREGKFRGDSSLKTFIFSVARNLWLKNLKRKKSFFADTDETKFEISERGLTEINIDSEKEEKINRAIAMLGRECREVLTDYYYNNLSSKDIMEKFGLGSEQAAKNKKYRCMQSLIKLFKVHGEGDVL